MGDIAFIYDKTKGFSDIKVVGGDFLLCDSRQTDVVEVESDGIPDYITISGTGTVVDDKWARVPGLWNGKPRYGYEVELGYVNIVLWDSQSKIWIMTEGDIWEDPTDSFLPPKTWSAAGKVLGSPPPNINYEIPETTDSTTYLISSLQVAVEISLFTDRRATTDEIRRFQVGTQRRQSRRGYWPNTYKDNAQGSGLWLLQREKKTAENLSRAKTYCEEAIQWLIDDGVILSADVTTEYDGEALIINIVIMKPDGQEEFKYQYAWDALEAR